MEMHQIRYFLAVCDTLNFTRGATACNVSQPALTRAVRALEDELGGPLFNRERNNTHLTELGDLMRPYLAEVYAQTAAAKAQAHKFGRLDGVRLKVGAMCTIGPALISDLLIAYSAAHPGVEIEVVADAGRVIDDALRQGEIEVALYGLPEELDDQFHVMSLFSESFVIVVNCDHRLANVAEVRAGELDSERYVSRSNCEFYDYAGRILVAAGSTLNRVFSSERDDWVQGMIAAGLGIGLFPELCVTAPELLAKPLVEPEIRRTINLVTARGRPHSPAVGAFLQAARRHQWPVPLSVVG